MDKPVVGREARISLLERNVEEQIAFAHESTKSQAGTKYLKHGFTQRYYAMRHCREWLQRRCFIERTSSLPPDIISEAGLHLNAYYLYLRGALDNLAWILKFELDLFPDIDERSQKRSKISLSGKSFISAISDRHDKLRRRLKSSTGWASNFKNFRDPAAHRIPLYIPPGVITSEEQLAKFKRLDTRSGLSKRELKGRRRIEIMEEARNVANYKPVFTVDVDDKITTYDLPKQLLYDHRQYLHLSRIILKKIIERA